MDLTITDNHLMDAIRLRAYFPARIIWLGFDETGKPIQGADFTRRKMNKLIRGGCKIWELTTNPTPTPAKR